jgi:hypothetical protein
MGANQAFIEATFQRRLGKPSEFRADVSYLRELLEQYGWEALTAPTFARLTGNVTPSGRLEMLLKSTGVWTHLWLEERLPNVFVIHDRPG